jgi:hypothetical protein
MNDFESNSKHTEKTSPSTSIKRPSDDFVNAIIEASARYGNNTELFLKENPQFDRRINRTCLPKEP